MERNFPIKYLKFNIFGAFHKINIDITIFFIKV